MCVCSAKQRPANNIEYALFNHRRPDSRVRECGRKLTSAGITRRACPETPHSANMCLRLFPKPQTGIASHFGKFAVPSMGQNNLLSFSLDNKILHTLSFNS